MRSAVETHLDLSSLSTARVPDVSVIVPVAERPESLAELYQEYAAALTSAEVNFEFLFVFQPWGRDLAEPLTRLVSTGAPIRTIESGQVIGEAALLKMGAAAARSSVVLTLPAYRRVTAEALPQLLARIEAGAEVAVARRWPRRDSWINRVQGQLFHRLLGGLPQGRLHDIASGVTAMRREVLQQLPVYGDFHRFLPLLALREGYRVEEVEAAQHRADVPARVYSLGTYLRRLVDVLGLFFLIRFTEKPLRFFGLIGALFVLAGGSISSILVLQRLQGAPLTERPLLILGVMLVVLGVQAIALGLIGEMIVHLNAPRRRAYRLRE